MRFIDNIQNRILYIRNCRRELETEAIKKLMEKNRQALKMMGAKAERTAIYSNGKTIYLNSDGAIVNE